MRGPLAEFRAAAEAAGLITADNPLDAVVINAAPRIVERCAGLAEPYSGPEHSAADAIRAELGRL